MILVELDRVVFQWVRQKNLPCSTFSKIGGVAFVPTSAHELSSEICK